MDHAVSFPGPQNIFDFFCFIPIYIYIYICVYTELCLDYPNNLLNNDNYISLNIKEGLKTIASFGLFSQATGIIIPRFIIYYFMVIINCNYQTRTRQIISI